MMGHRRRWCLVCMGLPILFGLGYGLVRVLPLPPCMLKDYLGIPCAMCGGTRASLAWHQGQLAEAWSLNPLVTLGIGLMWLVFMLGLLGWFWPKAGAIPAAIGHELHDHPYRFTLSLVLALLAQWGWAIWSSSNV